MQLHKMRLRCLYRHLEEALLTTQSKLEKEATESARRSSFMEKQLNLATERANGQASHLAQLKREREVCRSR